MKRSPESHNKGHGGVGPELSVPILVEHVTCHQWLGPHFCFKRGKKAYGLLTQHWVFTTKCIFPPCSSLSPNSLFLLFTCLHTLTTCCPHLSEESRIDIGSKEIRWNKYYGCVWVCVYVRQRKSMKESRCECVSVCVRERKCVCMFVWQREYAYVCERACAHSTFKSIVGISTFSK